MITQGQPLEREPGPGLAPQGATAPGPRIAPDVPSFETQPAAPAFGAEWQEEHAVGGLVVTVEKPRMSGAVPAASDSGVSHDEALSAIHTYAGQGPVAREPITTPVTNKLEIGPRHRAEATGGKLRRLAAIGGAAMRTLVGLGAKGFASAKANMAERRQHPHTYDTQDPYTDHGMYLKPFGPGTELPARKKARHAA